MTVGELIKKLKGLPTDQLIIMSKDGEGNSYSPLADISFGRYVAQNTWSGDLYDEEEDLDHELGEGASKDAVFVTCLWPTN